ncbi:MAG TPA: PAS domain-containing protein [Streptosporangiaceae bacterium]
MRHALSLQLHEWGDDDMDRSSAQAGGYIAVRWLNRHALVTLPTRIDQSNAEPISRQLLALVSRDLLVLIVDLSGTTDCGHACGEALTRVYQRAMITGTDLRLIAGPGSGSARRMLLMTGLDRVTPMYDSAAEAVAATLPADGPSARTDRGTSPPARPSDMPPGRDAEVEIALLDRDGIIVWVNQAWQAFATANGGKPASTGPGVSYLDVCAAARDDPVATRVRRAVRQALAGDLPGSLTVEVPCHSPDTARWYDMLISPRRDDDGQVVGATVTLSLVRSQTLRPA